MATNLIARLQETVRSAFDTGKQQVQALKLTNERGKIEKERARAVAELGHLAWAQRVQHPQYAPTMARLAELEAQQQAAQAESTMQQQAVQQDEALKQQLRTGFAARLGEARQQQQAVAARLAQAAGAWQQADEAERLRLSGEQQQIQAELTACEGRLNQLQAEESQALAPIDERLAQAQRRSKEIGAELKQAESSRAPLLATLGTEVLAARPAAPVLQGAFNVIAGLDAKIATLQGEIDALKRSGGGEALERMLLVGGGGLLLVFLLVGGAFWAIMAWAAAPEMWPRALPMPWCGRIIRLWSNILAICPI